MPIDPSIALGVRPVQVQNPLELASNALQLQGLQQQNALTASKLQEAQAVADERNALRSYFSGSPNLDDPTAQAKLYGVAPTQAGSILKGRQDILKSQADIEKSRAEATKATTESAVKAMEAHRSLLTMVNDPQQASAWIDAAYANPALAPIVSKFGTPEEMKARIPTDPASFQQWKQANAMGAEKYIENQTKIRGQDVERQNNIDTNKTHVQTTAMTNATSRANNAATIQKDLTVAGISPDGSVNQNVEQMAQAIASGKAAPITGFALAKPQGQTVMRRVFEINPQYDETGYAAKIKAAKDFGSGQQGNAMRSFQVAGQHLDQLGQLVDALNNRDTQLINRVGNAYQEATGNPAPTNFDAAKDVVSKEVVKAIVAGGGGVSEREELARLMDKAKSPAQLKGVIQQYRNLMGAQHDALLQQRRALGLSDTTLPNYGEAAPTQAAKTVVRTGTHNGKKVIQYSDGSIDYAPN